MGTTEITGKPKRVVTLDTGELDSTVALGVTPVGAVEAIPGEGLPDYLAQEVQGIETVGTIEQPNIEAIAALEPDLILSSKLRHEKIYDQLSRIAPTVFTEEVGVSWRENFELHGRALGLTEKAADLERDYERQVAGLRRALGQRRAKTEVSVVRSVGDEVRIYANESFIGSILEDVGLPRPEPQDKDTFDITLTPESIPIADGDVMFLGRFGDEHQLLDRLMDSPLWDRLSVVREGDIYAVPDDRWFLGIGNLAARQVLDDMETILVDGKRLPAAERGARSR